ncbi:alpha/beta hydrolase [Cupriavidus taiwanensis]|uniref:alpha/beta hydrolase n=1 Tax=Cupriavidus taiwanensis TaxID=164546 RepID=UPI000E10B6DA|nr:alpha/beta hydrolase [Cupriavidus taiwanensis]SOY39473.1 putative LYSOPHOSPHOLIPASE [Cupriavidus taiwanensis]SOY42286.1 putative LYSOPHOSPHOLIPASE [Cupriavidus taiwanensis]SOY78882.1 putative LYSOPHOSPHOLIPASE [Cupriavidus taiwanensis]SOZ60890.1 putative LYSOPHOSPHOLIPASE [Cupriavidus taiwanensis]SOZ81068.1 putative LYSOPHOSPHOLIPASE [Cupriavidus taiwanensis]
MEQPMTDDPAMADVASPAAASPAGTHAPVQSRQRMRDGTELLLRTWQPDPARFAEPLGSVLLVHGLAEHAGRYQHVADLLCGLGLRVRAFDLRGHGASGGARMVAEHPDAYLNDLAEIYDAVVPGWHELPILLGHSMGGLIAARFATARVRPVRALVLSSPALALRLSRPALALHRVLLTLAPRLRVPNPIDARYLSHDPAVVAAYRADPLVQTTITAGVLEGFIHGMAQAQADAALLEAPTLMLVGGADRVVDPSGSRAFFNHAPPDLCEQVWFDHGYHEIFNEAQPLRGEVFAALTGWLQRRLASPQR